MRDHHAIVAHATALKDFGYQVLAGQAVGQTIQYDKNSGWTLEDRAGTSSKKVTGANGWSVDIGSALDALSRKQFESSRHAVRENLQNARDARPRTGIYAGEIEDDHNRRESHWKSSITYFVDDDGQGMGCEEVGEYLLGIFSSSKKEDLASAGKHGIGFISNLGHGEGIIVDTKKEGHAPLTIVAKGMLDENGELRPDRYDVHIFPGRRTTPGTTTVPLNVTKTSDYYDMTPLTDVVDEFCSHLDVPLYVIDDEGAVKKVNTSLSELPLEDCIRVSSEEIRDGVLGTPVDGSIKGEIAIQQNGVKVDSILMTGIGGVFDAIHLTPIIGRRGFIKDEAYSRFTQELWGAVTQYADSVASAGDPEERKRDFLFEYLGQQVSTVDGVFPIPLAVRDTTTIPKSVRAAKIFPTVFSKAERNLETRLGSPDGASLAALRVEEDPEHELEYVSLDEIEKAIKTKGKVYSAKHVSGSAEVLRSQGHLVLGRVKGISHDDEVADLLQHYFKRRDLVQTIETMEPETPDILSTFDSYTPQERAFVDLLQEISHSSVELGRIVSHTGEPVERKIATNGMSEHGPITSLNMHCPLNVQLLEAFTRDPEDPLVRLTVQALSVPTIAHEDAHGVGYGSHNLSFWNACNKLQQHQQDRLTDALGDYLAHPDTATRANNSALQEALATITEMRESHARETEDLRGSYERKLTLRDSIHGREIEGLVDVQQEVRDEMEARIHDAEGERMLAQAQQEMRWGFFRELGALLMKYAPWKK